jgi:hypothetical protein
MTTQQWPDKPSHLTEPKNQTVPLPAVRLALGLFASCIKSGEQWTDTCQQAADAAWAELSAAPTASTRKPEDPYGY